MNHLLIDDWFFLLTAHQMISHHFSHASCCVCVCVCLDSIYSCHEHSSSEDLFFPYMDVHHNEGRSQAHAALISVIKMFYFTF